MASCAAESRRCCGAPGRAPVSDACGSAPWRSIRSPARCGWTASASPLSKKEYALLQTLASEPTRVFTREELLRGVWGFQSLVPTCTLDSHASRLRRKLSRGGTTFVVNVWGVRPSKVINRSA